MKIDLLEMADGGGCSSKIPALQLEEFLKHLPLPEDPDILVNISNHDDAGVYRINDELALVFTNDFFPPVCSDPYEFGQIAAVNALSDVYAMGGRPVVALNIMMFPSSRLSPDVYAGILRGGYETAAGAGVSIIGGHTIDDPVPKYGLAVIGFVHPSGIITNAGAMPGDSIILTKPLGTGIILAANRLGLASQADISEALASMKQLNKPGADIMKKYGVKGATDITGFGLAGHTLKMARASEVSITLNMKQVRLIGNTLALVEDGCIPGAAFRNLDYIEKDTRFSAGLAYNLKMAACDAQTSGGLLISAAPEIAGQVVDELSETGFHKAAIIGKVTERSEKLLYLNE
ncbi:MAG TPA: selenide, water dikinase SelD [Bacteroidales bacterium]|nr:selenide, water dikinase SelD [Bacteroidales bacterium]HNR42348.1 selenide, water dikinase SelD [Bacteroidales bacterium]HPM18889.1 selenide, water dikinase SelD [Bacteroidales bacterium]